MNEKELTVELASADSDIDMLKNRLSDTTTELKDLRDEILMTLAGTIETPEKGYNAEPAELVPDIKKLVAEVRENRASLAAVQQEAERYRKALEHIVQVMTDTDNMDRAHGVLDADADSLVMSIAKRALAAATPPEAEAKTALDCAITVDELIQGVKEMSAGFAAAESAEGSDPARDFEAEAMAIITRERQQGNRFILKREDGSLFFYSPLSRDCVWPDHTDWFDIHTTTAVEVLADSLEKGHTYDQ